MPATPSPSDILSATSPSVTVMLDELTLAFGQMGLTKSVSAAELYHTILRLQATPPPPRPPTTPARRRAILQSKSNHDFMPVINNALILQPISVAMDSSKDQGFPIPPNEFVMIEPGPEFFSPVRRERRRKMLELA
jgi:hypothetical protein